ncbi:thyroid hormone-inducible hepatic protein-like [Eublepharis macularius]|uniref:Thyroid hormone-inducible hepatic protein-like n=1 Tax=Eublepharis macularius TaxID=481883 RepID=A0AA97KVC8_EUBMA|nr:thyroid hormone-inducible hepatic protein-like [Eublepharis macularius]
MEEYFSTIRKMEQTVMFPSLLQGVTLEEQDEAVKTDSVDKDLYHYFTLLKSIKMVVESGLVPLNDQNPSITATLKEEESQEKINVEGLFYYHVSGLYHVLTKLTRKANAVISKYDEIIAQINQNRTVVYW